MCGIGQSQGFYEREDLVVTKTPTPDSVNQFQHLNADEFDLAFTGFDNLVAYNKDQCEVPLLARPTSSACWVATTAFWVSMYDRRFSHLVICVASSLTSMA